MMIMIQIRSSVVLLLLILVVVSVVVTTSAFSNGASVSRSTGSCLFSMTTTGTTTSTTRSTETENKLSLLQNTKYDSSTNQRMTTSKFPPAYSTSSWWKGPYSQFNQGFQGQEQDQDQRSVNDGTLATSTPAQRLTTSDSLSIPSYSTQYDQQRSDFINNPYGGTTTGSSAVKRTNSLTIQQRQDDSTSTNQPRLTTSDSLAIPAYSTQYDEKRSNFINNPYGTSQLYQNKKDITTSASSIDEGTGTKQQQRLTTSDSLSIPSYSTQYDTQRSNFINNPYGTNRLYEQQQAKQCNLQLQLSAANGSVPATTSYDQQRNAFINTPYGRK